MLIELHVSAPNFPEDEYLDQQNIHPTDPQYFEAYEPEAFSHEYGDAAELQSPDTAPNAQDEVWGQAHDQEYRVDPVQEEYYLYPMVQEGHLPRAKEAASSPGYVPPVSPPLPPPVEEQVYQAVPPGYHQPPPQQPPFDHTRPVPSVNPFTTG